MMARLTVTLRHHDRSYSLPLEEVFEMIFNQEHDDAVFPMKIWLF